MKPMKMRATLSERSAARHRAFRRKLDLYSTAASLGAFACSTAADGALVVYDIRDITITNNLSGISQFIDIHADGPDNPDGSSPEWQIQAPGALNQIRIDTIFDAGIPGDERPSHSNGSAVLSLFGNPGSTSPNDPFPGYYVESFPSYTNVGRAPLSPSFYVGLAARSGVYPNVTYNRVGTNRLVGLMWDFDDTDDVRYGWAQIDVTPVNGSPEGFFSATLTSYAIQTTPNKPANCPEPNTLALLAAGGGGLVIRRRRELQEARGRICEN